LILSLLTGWVAAATLLLGMAAAGRRGHQRQPGLRRLRGAGRHPAGRADIAAYVPTTHRPVFLTAVDQASLAASVDRFPPDPIQPDVVAASVILDGLTADTSDLQSAGLVSDDGLFTIATDINSLESAFFTPIDPC
jgi:hypothetical protein